VLVCGKVDRIRQESCKWQEKMEEKMSEGGNAESTGQMEEMIGSRSWELSRVALEEMMQAKADQSGRKCPVCGKELIRNKAGAKRTIESRFGPVKVSRQRGWCPRCQEWMYPADHALGLTQSGCTPGMQEMAALMVSKMPVGRGVRDNGEDNRDEGVKGEAGP
jgi:ribosomal protein S27AE